METLCPTSLVSSSPRWLIHHSHSTSWTKEENKRFESALAIFDEKTPNRWFHVAAMIPGKSVYDVMNQYRELVADISDIDAGLVSVPGYMTSSFTVELAEEHHGFDVYRKRGSRTYNSDHERKKGVPWTEDEHRRFLLGLEKHGKGDWRNISRNFVISKTPTQVASHAQKYYLRQLSGGKDKKRPSIHDITTTDTHTNTNNKPINSKSNNNNNNNQLIITSHMQTPSITMDHSMHNRGANLMVFDSAFAARPNDIASRFIVNIGASDQGFGLQSAPRNSHF